MSADCPFEQGGFTAIAARDHRNVALKRDGTVVAWGGFTHAKGVKVLPGLADVIAITPDLALRRDGTVAQLWGTSTVPEGLAGVTAIASGAMHGLALRADGTVVAWSMGFTGDDYGQARVPEGLRGVTAIAAGAYHSLALRQDGMVVAWGFGDHGQTTIPHGLRGVVDIAAGDRHSLAVRSDATVVVWGDNSQGQALAYGLSGMRSCAGGNSHSLGLRTDGTVVAWGENGYGQTTVPAELNGVVAIAAGTNHSVALTQDGMVRVWGDTFWGEGMAVDLADMTGVSSSNQHHVAATKFGTVTVWDGPLTVADSPHHIPAGLDGVVAVQGAGYAPFQFTVALKADGTVVAWGYNLEGETDVPPGLSDVTAISAGRYHVLALKRDGTMVSWGDDSFSQRTIPPGLTGVRAISAGVQHSLAVRSNGTVAAWGWDAHGQCQVPGLTNVIRVIGEYDCSTALMSNGSVVQWGKTSGPVPSSGVSAIASAYDYGLFLMNDGTVRTTPFAPSLPLGLTGVTAMSANSTAKVSWLRVAHRPTAAITLTDATIPYDGLPHALVGTVAGNEVEITRTTYNGSPVPPRAVGAYTVEAVVDTMGWTGRATATLTITPVASAPPTFAVQPANATVFIGQAATYRVETGGLPVPTVQWQRSDDSGATWRTLSGATSATYVTGPVQAPETGAWFRCVATNSAGSAVSQVGWLIVHSQAPAAPVFTMHPASVNLAAGNPAVFRVEATGSPTWQWQVSLPGTDTFTSIPGATQDIYITRCLTARDSGTRYRCRATNGAGRATSTVATILVTIPRRIVMEPTPGPRWWEADPPFIAEPPSEGVQAIIGPQAADALVRPEAPASSN